MVNKEVFHDMHLVQVYAPLTCAATANVEAAFGALCIETGSSEGNCFVLKMGTAANSDYQITLMESATAAGAGSAVALADCKVRREDGDVSKVVGSKLTTTLGTDTAHTYFFEYFGNAAFIRLTSTVGTQATIMSCDLIKTHLRHAPAHA